MSNQPQRFLAKPWIIETIVFFLVLWQEAFRLESRTAQRALPMSPQLQDFYYYHCGDFVNGYAIAYLIDGIVNMVFCKRTAPEAAPVVLGCRLAKRWLTLCATVLSGAIIVALELGFMPFATTSDIADIPAGLMGALVYGFIRVCALRLIF